MVVKTERIGEVSKGQHYRKSNKYVGNSFLSELCTMYEVYLIYRPRGYRNKLSIWQRVPIKCLLLLSIAFCISFLISRRKRYLSLFVTNRELKVRPLTQNETPYINGQYPCNFWSGYFEKWYSNWLFLVVFFKFHVHVKYVCCFKSQSIDFKIESEWNYLGVNICWWNKSVLDIFEQVGFSFTQ